MIDSYKTLETPKTNIQLGIEGDEDNNPCPLIDPQFSILCQEKMNKGESILADMKDRYPDCVPQLDCEFVNAFLKYLENENPDFTELLEAFLNNNTELLLHCKLMSLLFKKIPDSFHYIYLALKNGGDLAFADFENECGFYIITDFSSKSPDFNLAISQILQLTITKITSYDDIFLYPGIGFDELMSAESEIVFNEYASTHLIINLLNSEDNEVILNTLKALEIAFKENTQSRVILGYILMNPDFFNKFIFSRTFSEQLIYTFSAGLEDFPLVEKSQVLDIAQSLLQEDDAKLNDSGIELVKALFQSKNDFLKVDINESPLDIFQDTEIIRLIFKMLQEGTYRLKISSLKTIAIFIKNSYPKDLPIFLVNGLFQIMGDIFAGENGESVADKGIIKASIEVLKEMLEKGIFSKVQDEDRIHMISLFKYFQMLSLNEDPDIAKDSSKAYWSLFPFYAGFLEEEEAEE